MFDPLETNFVPPIIAALRPFLKSFATNNVFFNGQFRQQKACSQPCICSKILFDETELHATLPQDRADLATVSSLKSVTGSLCAPPVRLPAALED